MKNLFHLLVFYASFISCSFAQHMEYKFRHLGIEQGLSQSTVYSILQDDKGFMWFATQSGLARYDGNNFRIFLHHETGNSISGNWLRKIYKDRSGKIWVCTAGDGLCVYDINTGKFSTLSHDKKNYNSLLDDNVNEIMQDHEGNFWISYHGSGLSKYNISKKEFTHYIPDPNDPN